MSSTPSLNLAQQEAVNHLHGPCLVLAGAGSGKTRVITHKMARLIQAGVEPSRIAAITFTNKAAAEMRERARGLIGRAAKQLVICTFHALGVRMLREDGAAVGLKARFSILDSDDVASILKDAGGSTDIALARQWQWTISRWKNMGLNAAQAEAIAKGESERVAARVMARYEERLAAFQSVDFDDLIGLPLKLLQQNEATRAKWQAQMAHVLVDEYQDTNATQYELLKLLVGGAATARFTAVGDDDQSIYGWRGATLDNLKRLPLDFPTLKVVKLEQNYRSTSAILRAANNVIGPNPKLFPKNLWSELGEGEPVRVLDADNEEHEAERAVARIQSLMATPLTLASVAPVAQDGVQGAQAGAPGGGVTLARHRDFAVLYRANHQSRVFEQALRKAGMPYKVSGGQSFFDRAEIKDLCAWLRLWVNNDDDPAFLRAVGTPKRGIGHQTLDQLGRFASQYRVSRRSEAPVQLRSEGDSNSGLHCATSQARRSGLSLFEALFSPSLASVMSARALGGLHEFGRSINDLEYRARQTMGAEDALRFLLEWLKDLGYEQHLQDNADSPAQAGARWTHVLDFCQWMANRCGGQAVKAGDAAGSVDSEAKSLLEVAQTIALLSTIDERQSDPDVVTLSTLHAAKGLEWPHVMLVGVNEGMLPFQPSEARQAREAATAREDGFQIDPDAKQGQAQTLLEEERRLMYVGITRAQRSLSVSWSKKRKQGRSVSAAQPSRFIAEMALDQAQVREDPRAKLRALRAEFASKAAAVAP